MRQAEIEKCTPWRVPNVLYQELNLLQRTDFISALRLKQMHARVVDKIALVRTGFSRTARMYQNRALPLAGKVHAKSGFGPA